MQQTADEHLMLNYQKGDAQAMNELLERYKNPIYRFAFRMMQNSAEAADVAQEVFLRLHQHRDAYRPSGKFSTWIFSIAHNLCVSKLRKKKWLCIWPRKDDQPDKLIEIQSPGPSPGEAVASDEFSNIVKQCIQGLPFLQREALILREYEKLGYQEIAGILKKSLGTVKTLIHRARQNLKNKLLPYLQEVKGGYDV